ncbi:Solute Carrier Family 17 Member 9 [Manis pentadactyla]|nr:Solute Carrier Family 17 Member 9 [Manis pentadactyla]
MQVPRVPSGQRLKKGYTLTAAKLSPGLKGLAWASWRPVIQRCSRLCSFFLPISFLNVFLKRPNNHHDKNPSKLQPPWEALQSRSPRPRVGLFVHETLRVPEVESPRLLLK